MNSRFARFKKDFPAGSLFESAVFNQTVVKNNPTLTLIWSERNPQCFSLTDILLNSNEVHHICFLLLFPPPLQHVFRKRWRHFLRCEHVFMSHTKLRWRLWRKNKRKPSSLTSDCSVSQYSLAINLQYSTKQRFGLSCFIFLYRRKICIGLTFFPSAAVPQSSALTIVQPAWRNPSLY